MKTACPSCGADVEFRYDDSFVRVCSYCRAAVVRTDRGVDSLGKVADLVAMDSPLRLFADGQFGVQSFILVGMAQLRHGAGGLTQEWYARFSGTWGWLAEAQGRYYMTFEVEGAQLPPIESLSPGAVIQLPTMLGEMRPFTVGEVGSATYVAANGELPFRLIPGGTYRFVDLSDGQGNFATIDYGAPGEAATLYTGRQVTIPELRITGGEVGPARDATISSARLACPNCNGPIELHSPDILRAACAYCSHLLDVNAGVLRVLGPVRKATPRIPLGTKGTFAEGEMTVIGYVERSAQVEGEWYPFSEYLLYAPAVGFRWLVCSDGHWSYVQPVATGAVALEPTKARYDGVTFRLFQAAQLRVDTVLGEFYWQVQAGETVFSEDFVAPPAMLSREASSSEENWSLSSYLKPRELALAFGDRPELQFSWGTGIGPNQPDPAGAAAIPLTLAFLALLVLGIVFAAIAPAREKYTTVTSIPAGTFTPPPATAEPPPDTNPPNVFFSEPFELEAGKNVELGFRAALSNNWAYVIGSLVNVTTGDVVTVDASMEYYSGVDGGEAWSEGKDYATEFVSPVAAGSYVLRLEMQHGAPYVEVPLTVRVRQGVFRGAYLGWACVVLGAPFLLIGVYSWSFERRRWSNSTQGTSAAPKTPLTLVVGVLALVLGVVVVILKAIAESSSDD